MNNNHINLIQIIKHFQIKFSSILILQQITTEISRFHLTPIRISSHNFVLPRDQVNYKVVTTQAQPNQESLLKEWAQMWISSGLRWWKKTLETSFIKSFNIPTKLRGVLTKECWSKLQRKIKRIKCLCPNWNKYHPNWGLPTKKRS